MAQRKNGGKRTKHGDYEVGYCKPPLETRFKPGHSGNPQGRPRKSRNLMRTVKDVLNEPVTVRQGNKIRRIPQMEVAVRTLLKMAMEGDMRAIKEVLRLESMIAADPWYAEGELERVRQSLYRKLARFIEHQDEVPTEP